MSGSEGETPYWSVRARLEPGDRSHPESYSSRFRDVGMRTLTVALVEPGDDGSLAATHVTVEVPAEDAGHARATVVGVLDEIRTSEGLPREDVSVLWVAPLAPGAESSLRFLDQARELFDAGQHELAIVAAQIHLETHVSTLLRQFVEADTSRLGHALLSADTEWTFSQGWQRSLFESFLGVRPSKDFPDWKQYDAHRTRRNAVVHRGQVVDQQAARESLEVVDRFWVWLNEAALTALAAEHPSG